MAGGTRWQGVPKYTGPRTKRSKPRSCQGGTQLTRMSFGSIAKSSRAARSEARTFFWVITAALGSPLVPDVSCRKATSFPQPHCSGKGAVRRPRANTTQGPPAATTSRCDPFGSGTGGQHESWPHPSGSGGSRPRRDLGIESTGSRRQALQGEESADEGQTRGQHEDDSVAACDAKAGQATGEGRGLGPQLRVSNCFRGGGKSQSGGSISRAGG